jgi:RND family efflux transporter MFP subunit
MSGVVTERNAYPNQRVTPDSDLYTIVDLSRVWIMADVFETDIGAIRPGTPARVVQSYAGAAPLPARVNYIQPQVDPMTRTLKVRLELANPGMRLKPDMFVNVEFDLPGHDRLVVPVDAVLDTGERQTVFLDRGNGYLEPRQVQIGERLGDRVAILSGIADGERVVASGTFLIDSESQLKAAAGALGAPAHQHGPVLSGPEGPGAQDAPSAHEAHPAPSAPAPEAPEAPPAPFAPAPNEPAAPSAPTAPSAAPGAHVHD